ncbi:MAG: TPM domain-containing protein [Desulfovibrio sp.]|jgi:putative membrane protein|nr:TPM domain-containing protein [Desulfovibrio sp.]MBI4960332.1 TPM domain-containing protein [Desulfovibrio sp.]
MESPTACSGGILTNDQCRRIEAAVRNAEKLTSAQIVPLVVPASHYYPQAELVGGLILGYLMAFAVHFFLESESFLLFSAIFAVFLMVALQACRHIPVLKRNFLRKADAKHEVRKAAADAFHRHALSATSNRAAVLIYVSLFERRVWVLADKAADQAVGSRIWQDAVSVVTDAMRQGEPDKGLIQAVTLCGKALAPFFPPASNQVNELPDLILGGEPAN